MDLYHETQLSFPVWCLDLVDEFHGIYQEYQNGSTSAIEAAEATVPNKRPFSLLLELQLILAQTDDGRLVANNQLHLLLTEAQL